MMEVGLALGWTPAVFWSATAIELAAAVAGFDLRHGGPRARKTQGRQAPTLAEAEEMVRRFPDEVAA